MTAGLYSGTRLAALLKPQLYYLAIMRAWMQSGPSVPQFPHLQSGGILLLADNDSCPLLRFVLTQLCLATGGTCADQVLGDVRDS